MLRTMRALVIGTTLLSPPFLVAEEAEKDKLVDNPMYGAWANHKPGATATVEEKTTYGGEDKNQEPEVKVVTYTLLSTSPSQVVVRAVVVEQELLGTVESAPTKHTYPAKLKQSYVEATLPDLDAKKGEETVKWMGKDIKCKTLYGSHKRGGSEVEFKALLHDDVPGGVVKRTRTEKQGGRVVTTTITLKSYKAGK